MDIARTNVSFYYPLHFDLCRSGIPNAKEQGRWSERRKRKAVSVSRGQKCIVELACKRGHAHHGIARAMPCVKQIHRFPVYRIVTDLDIDLRNEIPVWRIFEFWLYPIRLRLRAVDLAGVVPLGNLSRL